MIFSDLYKSSKSPLSRLRSQSQPLQAASEFDADLVSKDKAKQKEAVKRYLASKIRSDWDFQWPRDRPSQTNGSSRRTASSPQNEEDAKGADTAAPRPAEHIDKDDMVVDDLDDDNDDTASTYSTVSEDATNFRPRLEWTSDLSDDDSPISPSAYRFDTPDAVGTSVQASAQARQATRRRAVREEEAWNPGLACFNARRDAWTGARMARVKPKPPTSPVTPTSSRRLSFFRFSASTSPPASPSASPLSPTATHMSGDTTAVASSDGESRDAAARSKPQPDSSTYPIETLLPVAPPLLPPANPMRASITPATYPSIYDRIVVHSMTPSCPVNLSDVLRSCVAGWKRDGEWPSRPVDAPTAVMAVRRKKRNSVASAPTHNRGASSGGGNRRLSLGFLGRRDSAAAAELPAAGDATHEDTGSGGKGIRKSLQRVFGIGHERSGSNASNTNNNNNGVVA